MCIKCAQIGAWFASNASSWGEQKEIAVVTNLGLSWLLQVMVISSQNLYTYVNVRIWRRMYSTCKLFHVLYRHNDIFSSSYTNTFQYVFFSLFGNVIEKPKSARYIDCHKLKNSYLKISTSRKQEAVCFVSPSTSFANGL